jgi:hypothetical protein
MGRLTHVSMRRLRHSYITLNVVPSMTPLTHFRSENIRAGHYRFSELKVDLQGLLS